MLHTGATKRFRGSKKRVERIRFTRGDKWYGVLLVLAGLLAVATATWVALTYND